MNTIIIGATIIIATIVICYTIYKIKTFKYSKTTVKEEIDSILDRYNKYELMLKDKDDNAWRYSVSNEEFVKVLNTVKRFYNN